MNVTMTIEWNGQEFVRTTRVPIEAMGAPNDPRPEVPETTLAELALLDRIGDLEKELEGVREEVKRSKAGWSAAKADVVEVRKELEDVKARLKNEREQHYFVLEANAEVVEVRKELEKAKAENAAANARFSKQIEDARTGAVQTITVILNETAGSAEGQFDKIRNLRQQLAAYRCGHD